MNASATQLQVADIEAELLQCRGIGSIEERVVCYDRIVDSIAPAENVPSGNQTETITEQSEPPIHQPETIPVPAKPAPASQTPARTQAITPEELFGQSSQQVNALVQEKLELESIDQIKSLAIKVQLNAVGEYVVYLDNGQVWQQKDDVGTWRIKQGDTAIITKAALGSYMMKVQGRNKGVRATRLKSDL